MEYFHIVKKPSSRKTNLPGLNGPLSRVIPSSTIAVVNEKVNAIDEMPGAANRTAYLHLTGAQKYQVENLIEQQNQTFPQYSVKRDIHATV